MVRIKGFDQLGNKRYKSGTRSHGKVRKRWEEAGQFDVTVNAAASTRITNMTRLGAEDHLSVDELDVDWGLGDDPSDEKIVMVARFNPIVGNAPEIASISNLVQDSEVVAIQNWRTIGTDSGPTETTPDELTFKDGATAEFSSEDLEFQRPISSITTEVVWALFAFATTTSRVIGSWKTGGIRTFRTAQRPQPMFEWAGYTKEEAEADLEDE